MTKQESKNLILQYDELENYKAIYEATFGKYKSASQVLFWVFLSLKWAWATNV